VTFRQLDVAEIVALAAKAGLRCIEWGGDVHVPVGDVDAAARARELCGEANLEITSYGSYYRADQPPSAFEPILATAVTLGAPSIRVWAGQIASADATSDQRDSVADAIAAVADLAAAQGVTINVEYHPNTLTDTLPSALALFDAVADRRAVSAHPVRSYYQPYLGTAATEALEVVQTLRDRELLSHLHVFSWASDGERLPLAARADLWQPVLVELAASERRHPVQLEFVADDDPARFGEDAAVLLDWVESAQAR
jgi:hypothetical protein